jgi:hypothetical protein
MTKRNALVTFVCLLVAVLMVGVAFDTARVVELTNNVAVNQQHDTRALCTFRGDLQTRVTSGLNFLVDHPKGIAGISAQTLQSSIANEQRTLTALHSLICPN